MLTRFYLPALACVLFGLCAVPPVADAAQVCGPRDKIVAKLGKQFNEDRKSLGLSGGASVIELYVSFKGSWTLVATNTKGVACLMAAGEAWQDAPQAVAGQDS